MIAIFKHLEKTYILRHNFVLLTFVQPYDTLFDGIPPSISLAQSASSEEKMEKNEAIESIRFGLMKGHVAELIWDFLLKESYQILEDGSKRCFGCEAITIENSPPVHEYDCREGRLEKLLDFPQHCQLCHPDLNRAQVEKEAEIQILLVTAGLVG